MQKLGFKGVKSFEHLRSLQGSVPRAAQPLPVSTRSYTDSIRSGSFASLTSAAEKLVHEQALLRAELDLASSKLKKSQDHVKMLEEKLQTSVNENSELKVKHNEHQRLRQGLESKLSLTKTLCNQLNETIETLTSQVKNGEKDKQVFEAKLSANSAALDSLNEQISHLSLKLDSADEALRDRDKMLRELRMEKQEREAFYIDQQCKWTKAIEEKDVVIKSLEANVAAHKTDAETLKSNLEKAYEDLRLKEDQQCKWTKAIEEKDAVIKSLEANVVAHKTDAETMKSNLEKAHEDLRLKEDDITQLKDSVDHLERENNDIHSTNHELADNLSKSLQEIQRLKDTANAFATELAEMDKESLAIFSMFNKLLSVYDTFCMLCKHEKVAGDECAKQKYDQLYQEYLGTKSEKDELNSVNQELNDQVYELQRVQESQMVHHAEECQLKEDQIRKVESEVEALESEKNENIKLIAELEEKIVTLSDSLSSSQDKTKELLLRLSEVESESKESTEKLQADAQTRADQIVALQTQLGKSEEKADHLDKQVSKLLDELKAKEELIQQQNEREMTLENQKTEIQALLVSTESKFDEARKQYDLTLENKQLELSKHLKEISQRNDQAINDIRKKSELEKQEILALEKDKAEMTLAQMERTYEERLDLCKKESELHLKRIQEEHAVAIKQIHEEYEKKESVQRSNHAEDLKRIQLQAETELREKIKALRNEHEVQLKALVLQHEDQYREIKDQLDLQRTKEERQKALLQLQWRVMSDKPEHHPEVNSEKEYSVTSVMRRDLGTRNRSMHAPVRSKRDVEDSPCPADQSPLSTLLRKVEKENSGVMMDMSKHGKKVTRREYEVETDNAGKVTKRRKTRSTVMFGDPRRHKKAATPKTPRQALKGSLVDVSTQPSNIGDLFTEGSLNPYADDPYAFD